MLAIPSMKVPVPAVQRPYCSGETSKYTVLLPSPALALISSKVFCMDSTTEAASSCLPTSSPIMWMAV